MPTQKELEEKHLRKHVDVDEKVPLEITNKRLFRLGSFLIVAIVATTGVILYFRIKAGDLSAEEVVVVQAEESDGVITEDTVVQTEVVINDEKKQLDRKDIRLEILNGAGVAGLAGKTQTTFEELGYEDIKVGNNELIEGNQLYINKDVDIETLESLVSDVKNEFDITKVTGTFEDDALTARVILGQ